MVAHSVEEREEVVAVTACSCFTVGLCEDVSMSWRCVAIAKAEHFIRVVIVIGVDCVLSVMVVLGPGPDPLELGWEEFEGLVVGGEWEEAVPECNIFGAGAAEVICI